MYFFPLLIYHTKLLVAGPSTSGTGSDITGHRDDSFREFRRLCAEIAEESSYLAKTKLVHDFINKGSSGGIYYFFIGPWHKKNTRKRIMYQHTRCIYMEVWRLLQWRKKYFSTLIAVNHFVNTKKIRIFMFNTFNHWASEILFGNLWIYELI